MNTTTTTLVRTVHYLSALVFSVFGILHVTHHFLATFYGNYWHVETQNKHMIRGKLEQILIWLPTAITYLSGTILLMRSSSDAIRFVKSQILLPFISLFSKNSSSDRNSNKKTVKQEENEILQKIRGLQLFSGFVLGACMTLHLTAVNVLRFGFRKGEAVNIFTASHAAHDMPLALLRIGYAFVYYTSFIACFFTHAVASLVKKHVLQQQQQQQQQQQLQQKREGKEEETVEKSRSVERDENTKKKKKKMGLSDLLFWWRVCLFTLVAGYLVGFVVAIGLVTNTTLEECNKHFPKELAFS